MPGDSPEVHQSCRILLSSSGAVLVGAQTILARRIPAPLVCIPFLVPFSWTFCLSPFVGEGSCLPHLVEVVQTPWRLLHPWVPLDVVCGFPLTPTILVLGSGAARPPSLLQALLCGAYFTSSCLGLSQGFTLP